MNEKLHSLGMEFDEALRRLAQTPKGSIDKQEKLANKAKAGDNRERGAARKPPRLGGVKTA